MKKSTRTLALAAVACVALSGCGQKKPSGQVVATVKGKEITSVELSNELGGFQAPSAEVRKAAERQALSAIITRKVLAQAAEKAGIAKTPAFAQQEQSLRERLLIQDWQQQIAKNVPPPSHEEVAKFITDHPDLYGQHKIFETDQVRFPRPANPEILKQLEPAKTLEDVKAFLTTNKVPFQEGKSEFDALRLDPALEAQIAKLPPGEVFLVPAQGLVIASLITNTRVEPVTNDIATRHATEYLKGQRTQQALQNQFGNVLAAAKKDIVYSKAYEPPKTPSSAAPKK
jgi:EpsD family peptidyl-prolyl cis-trans isomerase